MTVIEATDFKRPERLFNRNLVLLWISQSVSVLGAAAFNIALVFWLKQTTESAALMATIASVSLLPSLLLRPLGGLLADRFSRRRILLVCDLVSCLCILLLAVLMTIVPAQLELLTVCIALTTIVIAACNDFAIPALDAAMPDIVPRGRVAMANSIEETLQNAGNFVGVMLGGVILSLVSIPVCLFLNALACFASLAMVFFTRIPQPKISKNEDGKREPIYKGLLQDARAAFVYLKQNHGLFYFNLLLGAIMAAFSTFALFLPFYVIDFLGLDEKWFGFLLAVFGVGALAGAFCAGVRPIARGHRSRVVPMLLALQAAGVMLIGQFRFLPLVAFLFLLGGVLAGYLFIQLRTLVEVTIPSGMRGRALSLLDSIHAIFIMLGLGVGGWLGALLDNQVSVIYAITGACLGVTALLIFLLPAVRFFLASETDEDRAEFAQT